MLEKSTVKVLKQGDCKQTAFQECRPWASPAPTAPCFVPSTQPGVMVCQLFPDVCTGSHHCSPGTSERLRGRERQSACGYMCDQGDQESSENMSTLKQCWHLISRSRRTLSSNRCSTSWEVVHMIKSSRKTRASLIYCSC